MKVKIIIILLIPLSIFSKTIYIGSSGDFTSLSQSISSVIPGDTLYFLPGEATTDQYISNLNGTSEKPVFLFSNPDNPAIFKGGSSAIQFSDVSYLKIFGLVFESQSANGVNIDDGGTYDSPSHHIEIENCKWLKMNASGNNDQLKLSGLDSFKITNCNFEYGSLGGSMIDMVGCHNGSIFSCKFENAGSNAIQAKGGSSNVTIVSNLFINPGQRGINIGGSTGLEFFRPLDADFEAKNIMVFSNIFVGGTASIAFVGAIDCKVINNTLVNPTRWLLRILQENTDSRFQKCGNNRFVNNICYFNNNADNEKGINIGSNTAPETFIVSYNLWYNSDNLNWTGPNSVLSHKMTIINKNPEFINLNAGNYSLSEGSTAIAKGFTSKFPQYDFFGKEFKEPRSIGAIEYYNDNSNDVSESENNSTHEIQFIYSNKSLRILSNQFNNIDEIHIYDLNGRICLKSIDNSIDNHLDLSQLKSGLYFIYLKIKGHIFVKIVILS